MLFFVFMEVLSLVPVSFFSSVSQLSYPCYIILHTHKSKEKRFNLADSQGFSPQSFGFKERASYWKIWLKKASFSLGQLGGSGEQFQTEKDQIPNSESMSHHHDPPRRIQNCASNIN